jgi:hypothetical protein
VTIGLRDSAVNDLSLIGTFMNSTCTWIRRSRLAGILTVQLAFFAATAWGGQIVSTPPPTTSGPGLGAATIVVSTSTPNNDDAPGTGADNNLVAPLKRFDSTGFIDIEVTVAATQGVTEYSVTEFVDNSTGINWSQYTMLLGFGTGATFTQVGGVGDGLDFDTGPPGGNTTPPSSAVMPVVTRPNEDSLNFSGGIHGTGAQLYSFRIDVPDLTGRNLKFTLRQQPIAVPEPSAIALVGLAVVGLAMKRRFR